MMRIYTIAAAVAGSLVSTVYAQSISKTCAEQDLCYSLNIPESTTKSGNGAIFFQITAPTSMQWAALGQGDGMPGANIFVMYASADGQNVTVSPRLGVAQIMPLHDTAAKVTMLGGSGIKNGVMTANVRCDNCQSWNGGSMDFTSSSGNWIYAYRSGSALNSDDLSETISIHDVHNQFTWSFASAQGGDSANPFVTASSSSSNGNGGSTSSAGSSVTTSAPMSSSDEQFGGNVAFGNRVTLAHGVLAPIAFIAIFPLGAILIRVTSLSIWVHAAIQGLGLAIFIPAFGLGVYVAMQTQQVAFAHPIIGIILFVIVIFQPLTGLVHHSFFKQHRRRGLWTWEHLGIGRIAIILGIINGGLGLQLAGGISTGYIAAYAVCGAVMGTLYIAAVIFGEVKRMKNGKERVGSGPEDGEARKEEGR